MSGTFKLQRLKDGQDFMIDEVSLLMGRSELCDIKVTEGYPSREHARIAERGGKLKVQDLHSTNGTFVNNKQIEVEAELEIGDVLKIGEEVFTVQSQVEPEATILMRSLGSTHNVSATVIEDDDEDDPDDDATAMLEVYAMPPGWAESSEISNQVGKLDDKKRAAIDKYVEKFSAAMKGKSGIFLILFSDEDPPIFKHVVMDAGKTEWVFGRSDSCDIEFNNPCVSKEHATLKFVGGEGWYLEDNKSKNGISVDGNRQQKIKLSDNLVFEISSVDVLVRFFNG